MSDSDSSTLTGFLFYTFFVYPTTSYILKPRPSIPRSRSIIYAIAFLCLLAAVKTGLEIQDRGPNHYSILGVTRSSTPMEVKKAYKKLSLSLHPDKNPSPNAADEFAEVKASYDVLMDTEGRVVYNKFGDDGVKNNKSTFDEQGMLLEMGIFYATWGMLAFVLTLGKTSALSRSWIYTGLIVMLLLEITLMTTEDPLPPWWFPKTTEHEWIWLLHALFPAFMNGCRCLGGFLYVDLEEQTRRLLVALREQNKDVLLVLRDVQIGAAKHHGEVHLAGEGIRTG
ncbi:hypothetical protein TrRE_jg12840 [Triparma retinervis]|uniref:J domain-containing protein n=1 Tax=Triparma retinervis TaxID=2557542 RepID=A0A9W6ZS17_9STRA|nr:hypothetical protein TrRE_jg12840 [Triparma retinervis]